MAESSTETELPPIESPTADAIVEDDLELPPSGQELFLAIAAGEMKLNEEKAAARQALIDGLPVDRLMELRAMLGGDPAKNILVQREMTNLIRQYLIDQMPTILNTSTDLAFDIGHLVKEAEAAL